MRKLTALLAAGLVLGTSGQAMAITANASASVINPISIVETRPLAFGKVAGTTGGGSVILSAADVTLTTGSTAGLISGTGYASGKFTVTGESNTTYAITNAPTVVLSDGATHTMTATLTASAATGTTATTAQYTTATDVFYVGGTLTVAADQAVGSYTGTYAVTVAYN